MSIIVTTQRELFYWTAILFTFALGTAAGDLATESLQLGFRVGVLVFGALIAAATVAYYRGANPILTFWIAYVLTRPMDGKRAFGPIPRSWTTGDFMRPKPRTLATIQSAQYQQQTGDIEAHQ